MKEYDRVRLIKERNEYTKAGVKVGDTGIILGEKGWVIGSFILTAKSGKMKTEHIIQPK